MKSNNSSINSSRNMLANYNRYSILKQPQRKISCRVPLRLSIILMLCITIVTFLFSLSWLTSGKYELNYYLFSGEPKINFSTADNITGFDHYIVPNIVHFIYFDKSELTFTDLVCIKATSLHQKPNKIMIHCNFKDFTGKYWPMVQRIPNLEIHYLQRPTHIFGRKISYVQHASDIARIQILRKYGGIYLDNDCYIVKSLDPFRKFEMSLGWPIGQYLGTQVLIAHKDARFLPLYFDSYHQYNGNLWYYNAGQLPTTSILYKHPNLVHRVPLKFGVQNLARMLYSQNNSKWNEFYVIHLLINHKSYLVPNDYIKNFDEENIKTYNKTFGEMARLVLYGTKKIVK